MQFAIIAVFLVVAVGGLFLFLLMRHMGKEFDAQSLVAAQQIAEFLNGTISRKRESHKHVCDTFRVKGAWHGRSVEIRLFMDTVTIRLQCSELPRQKWFILSYPQLENGVTWMGKELVWGGKGADIQAGDTIDPEKLPRILGAMESSISVFAPANP